MAQLIQNGRRASSLAIRALEQSCQFLACARLVQPGCLAMDTALSGTNSATWYFLIPRAPIQYLAQVRVGISADGGTTATVSTTSDTDVTGVSTSIELATNATGVPTWVDLWIASGSEAPANPDVEGMDVTVTKTSSAEVLRVKMIGIYLLPLIPPHLSGANATTVTI